MFPAPAGPQTPPGSCQDLSGTLTPHRLSRAVVAQKAARSGSFRAWFWGGSSHGDLAAGVAPLKLAVPWDLPWEGAVALGWGNHLPLRTWDTTDAGIEVSTL